MERPDNRRDPYQLLRIELDEAASPDLAVAFAQLDEHGELARDADEALYLWRLLQRYCLFVDADEARSRRNTLSSRVVLRRIFCPAFRIGLVNSECYTLSRQHWSAFCDNPAVRADQYARTAC